MVESRKNFEHLLDESYNWPTNYSFKFIVPVDQFVVLLAITGEEGEVIKRPSKKGNYLSVTITREMQSASEIIDLYKRVERVPDLISL